MYFWTVLVLFLTSTCVCCMQPYQEALNSVTNKIFLPGQLQRDHLSSTSNTSLHIPKKGTDNIVLKNFSQSTKLFAYGTNGQFPPKLERTPPTPKDVYVPFDYHYTTKTEEFLTNTTEKFYECLKLPQQMNLLDRLNTFLLEKKDINHTCDVAEISEDFYGPSKNDDYDEYHSHCSRLNISYVKFLNKSVRRLSEHFFSGEIYVKLHPIDANVSDCVHNKAERTYEFGCKLNYQITIIKNFYEHVINILNGGYINHRDIRNIDYFVTVLFFLKFHPRLAAHYIAFVFFINKLGWTKNDWLATYPDLPFVPPDVEGKVEEIYSLRLIQDKLFDKILECTTFEEFDINIFTAAFQDIN